jgi:alkanesulfonate monooxygenase SsuD/methylene tetrahydromethanopterin reductase-like flavin-dependent oxidoreductase (luciferase family)
MSNLHLAVALDGAGWHPAVEQPSAELFTAKYWLDVVQEAERGLLDFVTIDDSFGPQQRLDAVLIASRVAPTTTGIGLVPTIVVTHTEPFHAAKAIATLDYVTGGRAGVRIAVSDTENEAAHFGRRAVLSAADLADEAADYVEVLRRLWDSWEDDAEIRDAATGRFVDRDKLHYVDFVGKWFSVKGPLITPRPPQGQPIVTGPYGSPDVDFTDVVVSLSGAGSATELADFLEGQHEAGVSGFRLIPGSIEHDLPEITRKLVPELQRRGLFRTEYEATTLRGLLGLPRPANRYATK